jgi:Domain of unknown function (DUF4037)
VTHEFIPGVELARAFYAEVVRPLLDQDAPGLPHSAALIGPGSEVLGFDSWRSTDHDWGPRLQVFLSDADDEAGPGEVVTELLAAGLPAEFRGYPIVFAASGAGEDEQPSHWVTVAGMRPWLTGALGFDPLGQVRLLDWLAAPTQVLAEITGGGVFHDGLAADSRSGGGLAAVRARLAWYPHDIWLHVLACQWQRISQEEPFPGRCAEAGDELGSAVVTARLVRDLMRLVLLMQRRYPPYSKWLGTAFARTAPAGELLPLLTGALAATSWADREANLSAAYEGVARLHNALGVTPPVDPAVRPTFYDRPYRVLGADRFVAALRGQVHDEQVRALTLAGAADQFIDNTDAIGEQALVRAAAAAAQSRVQSAARRGVRARPVQ